VGQLQIFQGGSVQVSDPKGLYYYSKTFSDVTISATSNALMVDENWWVYGYNSTGSTNSGYYSCGSSSSQQQSVVSIIDVSDPTGLIHLYTRFEAAGQIGDQFKMTYVFDPTKQTGTFYGIFARQGWSSSNCMGPSTPRIPSSRGTSPTAIIRPCRPAWTSETRTRRCGQHLRCNTECGLRRHLAEN